MGIDAGVAGIALSRRPVLSRPFHVGVHSQAFPVVNPFASM
jgi:hypothetical protein